jgi:hypothetical protein
MQSGNKAGQSSGWHQNSGTSGTSASCDGCTQLFAVAHALRFVTRAFIVSTRVANQKPGKLGMTACNDMQTHITVNLISRLLVRPSKHPSAAQHVQALGILKLCASNNE